MNPLPLFLASAGVCFSAVHAEYKMDILDETSGTPPQYRCLQESVSQTGAHDSVIVVSEKPLTLEEKISAVCSDPDSFEEGEAPPSPTAISDLKRVLGDALVTFRGDIPQGDVAAYFGELSITWRQGSRMLRLTSFSDGRNPRLDFGTTPDGSLGDYQFNPEATGDNLSDKLNWLLAVRSATS